MVDFLFCKVKFIISYWVVFLEMIELRVFNELYDIRKKSINVEVYKMKVNLKLKEGRLDFITNVWSLHKEQLWWLIEEEIINLNLLLGVTSWWLQDLHNEQSQKHMKKMSFKHVLIPKSTKHQSNNVN